MTGARPGSKRRLGWVAFFAACLAFVVIVGSVRGGRADAQLGPGELTTEPVLKGAAAGVQQLYGATPAEAPGEVWGSGNFKNVASIVRYTDATGWTRFPNPVGLDSLPLTDLEVAAGRTTASGGVVFAVAVEEGTTKRNALALRNPGGEFHLTPPALLPPSPEELEKKKAEEEKKKAEEEAAKKAEEEEAAAEKEEEEALAGAESIEKASAVAPEALFDEAPEEALSEVTEEGESPAVPPTVTEEATEGEAPEADDAAPAEGQAPEPEGPADREAEQAESLAAPKAEETPAGEGTAPEAETPTGEGTPTAELEPVEVLGEQPLIAASQEAGGVTGAFSVPSRRAPNLPQNEVLHFDGSTWSREMVCMASTSPAIKCARPLASFTVIAIEATGPENAWLLGERGAADGIELFKREGDAWRQQVLGGSLGLEYSLRSPAPGVVLTPAKLGQPLTLSGSSGVWVNVKIGSGAEVFDSTIFVAGNQVEGAWCEATGPAASLCTAPLGSNLPSESSRSFAWPGNESEPFGTRVITGAGKGALLIFSGDSFERVALGSGDAGKEQGAAFDSAEEGWLGSGAGPLRVTRQPTASRLAPFPVPFRRPLTAIAPAPGQPVGSTSSEALAVGDQGQVARYLPGQGWVAESLLNSSGTRQTPRLRAVAWPEPGFAFAVGDEGAMWYWRKSTELWEPDPAAPPNLIRNNFMGIAFDPSEPARGYAVGKQGLLLSYGRQWTPEGLPAGVPAEANLTSISFAGREALVTWRYPVSTGSRSEYEGGVIANDGSGWKVVPELSSPGSVGAPWVVSALPDGGAVVAREEGEVIERDGPGAPWVETAEGMGGFPVALQALREGTSIRALVSVWAGLPFKGYQFPLDFEQVLAHEEGAPPLLTKPYPLPSRGYLERQTATGWRDEQHETFAVPSGGAGAFTDLPREPDPILALLVSPQSGEGWAVGGETGQRVKEGHSLVQTAGVQRFGAAAAAPASFTGSAITSEAGTATFAIGGGAQCAATCADQIGTGLGPEAWLASAVSRAASVPGVRAFLYAGAGVASTGEEASNPSKRLGAVLSPLEFGREETAYARRLAAGAAGLSVYPAPSSTDVDRQESLSTFARAFEGLTPVAGGELAAGYYAFDSTGEGTPVRVIVLDYAEPTLGTAQQCWIAGQLQAAGAVGEPAIVLGSRDLSGIAPSEARALDASEATQLLVEGTSPTVAANCPSERPVGASAYFFDFPESNRMFSLASGGRTIPAFGSGTLGYVRSFESRTDFTGASGFLLASVGAPDPRTDVAPVKVRLIPNIGELAMEAADGTLLRRSSVALFRGLARRPHGGGECLGIAPSESCESLYPDPYVPIPSNCRGAACSSAIFPEYKFTSSRPDIANFVAPELNSGSSHAVKVGADGKPIVDPTSGLLCAFNEGTTTVTLEAGGLAYSTVVTVQGGSVQRPCGTVPLLNPPVQPNVATPPVPAPTPTPKPNFPTPTTPLPVPIQPTPTPAPTPVPPTPTPNPTPPPPPPPPTPTPPPVIAPPPIIAPTPLIAPIPVIVPPAPPAAAEPAPPTGTSPVTQPAVSPQSEEEEEAAFDLVHHAAAYQPAARPPAALAAYRSASPRSHGSGPTYLLPLVAVFLAVAATGVAGRRRRRSPEPAYLRNRR